MAFFILSVLMCICIMGQPQTSTHSWWGKLNLHDNEINWTTDSSYSRSSAGVADDGCCSSSWLVAYSPKNFKWHVLCISYPIQSKMYCKLNVTPGLSSVALECGLKLSQTWYFYLCIFKGFLTTHWHSASPGQICHCPAQHFFSLLFFYFLLPFFFNDSNLFALFTITNKNRLAGESVK